MTVISDRYDAAARDYDRYWAPVLDASARRLLDDVAPLIRHAQHGAAAQVVDLGTGTGVLAIEAAHRWPAARILAVDASRGMLDVAHERAAAAGVEDGRIDWVHAEAARLPLDDASVDLVVSSFVLQLVPDRAAALGELIRILRPGGTLAAVTWLAERRRGFLPDEEFDEAVYDLGIDDPEDEADERSGDFSSPRAAAGELKRAGFTRVSARKDRLEYAWTLESYLDFKENYDERALMSELEADLRARLMARARERLSDLRPDDFRWRAAIVYATGQRPPDPR